MKTTIYKQIIDILSDPKLDYRATALEVAKSYPSVFAKCAVASEKIEIMTREQEERNLVMKFMPDKIISAIKCLRNYRIAKNLPVELCGLYICKVKCEEYRTKYNNEQNTNKSNLK